MQILFIIQISIADFEQVSTSVLKHLQMSSKFLERIGRFELSLKLAAKLKFKYKLLQA